MGAKMNDISITNNAEIVFKELEGLHTIEALSKLQSLDHLNNQFMVKPDMTPPQIELSAHT